MHTAKGAGNDSLQAELDAAVEFGIDVEALHRKIHELETSLRNAKVTIGKLRALLGKARILITVCNLLQPIAQLRMLARPHNPVQPSRLGGKRRRPRRHR